MGIRPYAVESCPWLRDVPGVLGTMRLSDILAALRALDDDGHPPPKGGAAARPPGYGLGVSCRP